MSLADTQPVSRKRNIAPTLLIIVVMIGFVFLIAAGLSVLAWMGPGPPLTDLERRLPDGSILRIEILVWSPVYDVKLPYQQPGFWTSGKATQVALNDGRSWTGPPGVDGQAELKIWMSRRDRRSGQSLDFDWWGKSIAVNSLGEEVLDREPRHWQISPHGAEVNRDDRPFHADRLRADAWAVASSFPAFPTDNGKFQLKVQNTQGETVATFHLMHPRRLQLQNWKAEELPTTKTNGRLSITLQGLQSADPADVFRGTVKSSGWYFVPDYALTENGHPTSDWWVGGGFTDSLGRELPTTGWRDWDTRHVWKVHLIASRKHDAPISSLESWTVKEVALPEAGSTIKLMETRSFGDLKIQLIAMGGCGKTSYSSSLPPEQPHGFPPAVMQVFDQTVHCHGEINGSSEISHIDSNWPYIAFRRSSSRGLGGSKVLINAHDDQHREVPTYQSINHCFFKTEPDAKSLRLTILVDQDHLPFEFFIKAPKVPEDGLMP